MVDLQASANSLKQQLDGGGITKEQYEGELRRLILANATESLQQQVDGGGIKKAQMASEIQRLGSLPASDLISQNITGAGATPTQETPLNATGQTADLQGAAASLRQQVADGLITADQANAQLRALSLQNAANNLQSQVGPGGITQQQAQAEYSRLSALAPADLVAQSVNAAPIKSSYDKGVAKPGSDTKKTEIGDVREINPAIINPTSDITGAQIEPVLNASVDAQTLEQQKQFIAALIEQSAGRGPSLAGLQLQQALEKSLKQQMGALASNPGISAALAARLFGQQAAEGQQDAAMKAAQTRIQEQLNAQTLLGTTTNQVQDAQTRVALANQLAGNTQNYNQAQLEQEAAKANALAAAKRAEKQAEIDQAAAISNQTAFNTANTNQAQITGGVTQAQLQAEATKAAAASQASATIGSANINADAAVEINAANNANNVSPTTSGVTSDDDSLEDSNVVGSDKKFKKNIGAGGEEARKMMDQLAAAIFDYKNKDMGEGKQVGVMAQDLEKSKLGSQMVEEKSGKKWVNFAKGLGAVLAAQADLNSRMKKIEAGA